MKLIIFNDKENFDGCLNLINKRFPKGQRRFWDINKYIPFLLKKVKDIDGGIFKGENVELIKTYFYTGKYNSKLIQRFKWNCNLKIKEINDIILNEKTLLKEVSNKSKCSMKNDLRKKVREHVKKFIRIFDDRKEHLLERIEKQVRNRDGQIELFKKLEKIPNLELKTTPLKQGGGEIYQKGVDVQIATDLVNLAHTGVYDIALILGGDSDLKECLKLVRKNLSKIIIVVAYYTPNEPNLSNISDLIKESDYFINLHDFSNDDINSMSEILQ